MTENIVVPKEIEDAYEATRMVLNIHCMSVEQLIPGSMTASKKTLSALRHAAARHNDIETREKMGRVLDFVLKQLPDDMFNKRAMEVLETIFDLARQKPLINEYGAINVGCMQISGSREDERTILSLSTRAKELAVGEIIIRNARSSTAAPDMKRISDLISLAPHEMSYNISLKRPLAVVVDKTQALQKIAITVLSLAQDKWPETATPPIVSQMTSFAKNALTPELRTMAWTYVEKVAKQKEASLSARQRFDMGLKGPRFRVFKSEADANFMMDLADLGSRKIEIMKRLQNMKAPAKPALSI